MTASRLSVSLANLTKAFIGFKVSGTADIFTRSTRCVKQQRMDELQVIDHLRVALGSRSIFRFTVECDLMPLQLMSLKE